MAEDKKATEVTISPDPEMVEYAITPIGKVSDMIMIHTKDSHFDLIVAGTDRKPGKNLEIMEVSTRHCGIFF